MRLFQRSKNEGAGAGENAASGGPCPELATIGVDVTADPEPTGPLTACEDCTALGEHHWAHLRMCLTCGHVACCDSSPRRHAAAHSEESGHPVMRSAEPGEVWRWCYVHEVTG